MENLLLILQWYFLLSGKWSDRYNSPKPKRTNQGQGKARHAWGCILSLTVFVWVGPCWLLRSQFLFLDSSVPSCHPDCFPPKLIPHVQSFYLPFPLPEPCFLRLTWWPLQPSLATEMSPPLGSLLWWHQLCLPTPNSLSMALLWAITFP